MYSLKLVFVLNILHLFSLSVCLICSQCNCEEESEQLAAVGILYFSFTNSLHSCAAPEFADSCSINYCL